MCVNIWKYTKQLTLMNYCHTVLHSTFWVDNLHMSVITSHLLSTAVFWTRINSIESCETDREERKGANCFSQSSEEENKESAINFKREKLLTRIWSMLQTFSCTVSFSMVRVHCMWRRTCSQFIFFFMYSNLCTKAIW